MSSEDGIAYKNAVITADPDQTSDASQEKTPLTSKQDVGGVGFDVRRGANGGLTDSAPEKAELQKTNVEIPSSNSSVVSDDPWSLPELDIKVEPFSSLSTAGKVKRVLWNYMFRQLVLIGLLYLFICSLDFLSSAFRLLGGQAAGEVFRNNSILTNPLAGLMIGVLATVLVQSSSTSTSIIVSMVGSRLLTVKVAIPIVMGANIGTSITNTIVSVGQANHKDQFRRAFAGATVHDMFNWLSVLILLPLEVSSGYLFHLSNAIVQNLNLQTYKSGKVKLLKALTEPFTHYVVKVDTKLITEIAENPNITINTLIQTQCKSGKNGTQTLYEPCRFMFMDVAGVWSDWIIGLIMLFIALIILCTCLIFIVKILNGIFKGHIAKVLRKFINANMPGKCGEISTGYIAILIGALFTLLVQSSSIFTSAITPLVGLGVLSLDRMYPLTLGSNIGTTFTAILSSLAQDGSTLDTSIQISLCHLFFNITGILIWYPIPFMRKIPIYLAKKNGEKTAKYRWFALMYLLLLYFILPGVVFALSILGWYVMVGVLSPFAILLIIIIIINILQVKLPRVLPQKLKTWDFLPLCLHSLEPLDRVLTGCCRLCPSFRVCKSNEVAETPHHKPESRDTLVVSKV